MIKILLYISKREIIQNDKNIVVPDNIKETTINKALKLLNNGYSLHLSKKPNSKGYIHIFLVKGSYTTHLTRTKDEHVIHFFTKLKQLIEKSPYTNN
ncbi:MAG: hypothetical protein QXZ59_06550 [Nitrososphaeria archaeon]